jgi:signal transduction histidine kinase
LDEGEASGFGLKAMRDRVERSGGALVVESEPGRGTTLVVELPVAADGQASRGAGAREETP